MSEIFVLFDQWPPAMSSKPVGFWFVERRTIRELAFCRPGWADITSAGADEAPE